jgi:hypothetical protein
MTEQELAEYSGESFYKKPRRIEAREIRLDGEKGTFNFIEKEGDEYVKKPIGEKLSLVLLRKRRTLNDLSQGMGTSEHNVPSNNVTLYIKGGTNEKGVASELREKYAGLRTNEIFYGLYGPDNELVKLTIKGASLGSEAKPKDSVPLYEYFNKFGRNEHIYEYVTDLSAIQETNKMKKSYYAISFSKGDKLTDMSLVGETLKELHNTFKELDDYYSDKKTVTSEMIEENIAPIPEYDGDMTVEDMPF